MRKISGVSATNIECRKHPTWDKLMVNIKEKKMKENIHKGFIMVCHNALIRIFLGKHMVCRSMHIV